MARAYPGRIPHDAPVADNPASSGIADGRCYVRGGGGSYGYPAAGGDVDGYIGHFLVSGPGGSTTECAFTATPGAMVTLESAAAFSAGAELAVTSDGRVQTKTAGQIAIARALDAATAAGQFVKAVWTSGRSA